MNQYPYLSSLRKEIVCICPKCRKKHDMQLFWSGNGMPRKYCRNCHRYKYLSDVLMDEMQDVKAPNEC